MTNPQRNTSEDRVFQERCPHLNDQQKEAILTDGALVLAGAGTGKTTVLTERIRYLLEEQHIRPERVLAVTFTRKAAEEMKEKLLKACRDPWLANKTMVTTFHAVMLRVLKATGFKGQIMSERQKEFYMKAAIRRLQHQECEEDWSDLLQHLSRIKNAGLALKDVKPVTTDEATWLSIMQAYEAEKHASGFFDFDDILAQCVLAISANATLQNQLQRQFKHILVDEYQDLNSLQFEFIRLISSEQSQVFAVGDARQAIYGFRGADNRYILEFQKYFKNHRLLSLNVNYRSTEAILALGNRVILDNPDHQLIPTIRGGSPPSLCRPVDAVDEARKVIAMIKEEISLGRPLQDLCILYRTSEASRHMIEALVLEGLPVAISGNHGLFYFKSPAAPVIGYLRLAASQYQERDLLHVLSSLHINRSKIKAFLHGRPDATLSGIHDIPGITAGQKKSIEKLQNLMLSIKDAVPQRAIALVRQSGYEDDLTRSLPFLSPKKVRILEVLDELEQSAERFTTIHDFLSFINDLESCTLSKERPQTAISLMTIHAAKGLEFPVVFLIGAVEGLLPHRNCVDERPSMFHNLTQSAEDPVEEERRLAYVAVTRAKERLYIFAPLKYRDKPTEVSRLFRDFFMS